MNIVDINAKDGRHFVIRSTKRNSSRGFARHNTADHLAALNRELVAAGATTMRVRSTTSGLRWTWDPRVLAGVLAPVALSAAELLSTPHALARVHVCESDDGCGWLFPDETRAGTRRWCDMRTCGNRAKAKRHYARVRNRSPRR